MNDDVSPTLGISRRDVLRRGAVVGGTLVWAAPAVQSISRAALAQDNGTPPPDDRDGGAISYVALVLTCSMAGGTTRQVRVKYEADGGWDPAPGETPHCMSPADWEAATPEDGGALGIVVTGDTAQFCFDLSGSPCTFDGGTSMGAAGDDHPLGKGFCSGPDAGWTATSVCFSDPNA